MIMCLSMKYLNEIKKYIFIFLHEHATGENCYSRSFLAQRHEIVFIIAAPFFTSVSNSKMNACQQHLWHCINTTKAITLVDFYNKLGLALRPLKSGDSHIFVSAVAPLYISEKGECQDKNAFVWTEQMCSEFERAFSPIQQTVCQNLAQVEVQNTCNFNRYLKCIAVSVNSN